ncbi:MAG TPA: hypothetical protein VEX63_06090 [Flavisolibacter sp.]|nr:hypothetical protein [Flavisolibacter sp.]
MKKISNYVFTLLKNTFIITFICLLLALLGGDRSFFESLFGTIGYYAAWVTIYLFFLHVLVVIITFLFQKNDSSV